MSTTIRLELPEEIARQLESKLQDLLRVALESLVVALFLDEFGYQRWPEVAPT